MGYQHSMDRFSRGKISLVGACDEIFFVVNLTGIEFQKGRGRSSDTRAPKTYKVPGC